VLQEMQPSPAHTFETGRWGATIVGSSAHPVAGDHLGIKVGIGGGCCAEVRSSGATVARRGSSQAAWSGPSGSSLETRVDVASDAMLAWRPEPGVAADGCQHRVGAVVELAASARLLWRDEFLVDRRTDAPPGTWSSRLRVVRDGWPVVCTELAVGPGSPLWESPAVLEGARAVSLMVVVDPEQSPQSWTSSRATDASATGVALPLAGPGVQIVAWGDELYDCQATIERMVASCGVPEWAAERWRHGRALDTVG
jgi:urease accessory protein